jgi:hypothetical protein
VFSKRHFLGPSVRRLDNQRAHILQYSISSWTVMYAVDKSRSVTRRVSKIRFSKSYVTDVVSRAAQSSWMPVLRFSNSLRHCLTCCSLISQAPYTSFSLCCISRMQICFPLKTKSHYEFLRGTKFSALLLLHINLSRG